MRSRKAKDSHNGETRRVTVSQDVVTVNIKPGRATAAQKALYRRFWIKLVSRVKDEFNNDQNPKEEKRG